MKKGAKVAQKVELIARRHGRYTTGPYAFLTTESYERGIKLFI